MLTFSQVNLLQALSEGTLTTMYKKCGGCAKYKRKKLCPLNCAFLFISSLPSHYLVPMVSAILRMCVKSNVSHTIPRNLSQDIHRPRSYYCSYIRNFRIKTFPFLILKIHCSRDWRRPEILQSISLYVCELCED
jgi:hypothetical protein